MGEGVLTHRVGNDELKYKTGCVECLSNDPFDVADFIDYNLDYQLKKLKGKGTASKIPDLNNNTWIDDFWDKQPNLVPKKNNTKRKQIRRICHPQIAVG
jgi:hypothetical protein